MKNGCDCVTEEAYCCVVLLLQEHVHIPGNGGQTKNPLTHLVSLILPFFSAGVSCECLVH
jgi:hypothetical protein